MSEPKTKAGQAMVAHKHYHPRSCRVHGGHACDCGISLDIAAIEAEARATTYPPAPPGFHWVPTLRPRTHGRYAENNPPHTHRAEYPSDCTGCLHLTADLAARLPAWMLPEGRATREELIEEFGSLSRARRIKEQSERSPKTP